MTDNLPELPDQPIWVACDVTGVLPHRLLTTEEDANAHKRQRYEGNPAWAVWKYLPQAAIASERARADALEAALKELVDCKSMKERAEAIHFAGPLSAHGENWKAEYDRLRAEYLRRQPLAWDNARSLLKKTNDR